MKPFSFSLGAKKRPMAADANAFSAEAEADDRPSPEQPKPKAQKREQPFELREKGEQFAESGMLEEAISCWSKAITILTDENGSSQVRAELYEMTAQSWLELDRCFDAVKAAKAAVELRADWGFGHLTLGRALLNYGEIGEARDALKRATEWKECEEEAREELERLAGIEAQFKDNRGGILNGRAVKMPFWETCRDIVYGDDGRPISPDKGPEPADPNKNILLDGKDELDLDK